MVQARTLAVIRAQAGRFLTDRCDILRVTPTTDSSGNSIESRPVVVADVHCRILPKQQGGENIVAHQEVGRDFFLLVVPYNTDLRNGDQIESGGDVYEVMQLEDARTDETDLQATIARME